MSKSYKRIFENKNTYEIYSLKKEPTNNNIEIIDIDNPLQINLKRYEKVEENKVFNIYELIKKKKIIE